jgi:hypothetical protein
MQGTAILATEGNKWEGGPDSLTEPVQGTSILFVYEGHYL